jgi:hypothetical protein
MLDKIGDPSSRISGTRDDSALYGEPGKKRRFAKPFFKVKRRYLRIAASSRCPAPGQCHPESRFIGLRDLPFNVST